MKKVLLTLTLAVFAISCVAQTGTGWQPIRAKQNFKDSVYLAKDANFNGGIRVSGVAITSQAAELNILDGALCSAAELNYLVGVTSNIQTQLNAKQATLVSGTTIKTVNGETLLGAGNIEISGEGGAMVYPGEGIPLSTGTAWGTSLTDNHAQWDTAYVASGRWTGGAISLVPATGRTSLGGTTVGQNIFTLTNPDAIRFLRINADNTVTALSAANFKTALSLTATDVSLGNVTNESKTTMFTSPTFTGHPTIEGVTSTGATGTGNLVFSASPTFTGTVTGTFSGNLTGNVTGDVSGNAGTVTGFTRNSGSLTLSGGHAVTLTTTGLTGLTLPTSGTLAVNPMTTAGDIVIGGTSGAPTRLAAGTAGYVLTMSGGAPAWAVSAAVALEARVDSIVTVLADTMNIETLLDIDLDTDTVADLSEVRLRVLLADSTDVYATPTQIADTMTARIAAATVGLAAADTNTYGGAATRTFVESLLGSGEGLSAQRLPFIIGVTTGAPSAADTIVVHSEFEGKHIDLYRDGAKQYQQFTATNIYEGFRLSNDTIYVNPAWQANEQVMVDIIEPILWSYLSLEGEESTLLTGLSGYWKLDETSGTTATDATGTQNGTALGTVGVAGKIGYANSLDASGEGIRIPHNNSVIPSGTAFSVSMWVWLDSIPSTVTGLEGYYLFKQENTASPWEPHNIQIKAYDDLVISSSTNTTPTSYSVKSSGILSDSTWHHVVFINRGDGQPLLLYIDGANVSTDAGTFTGTLFEGAGYTYFGNAYIGAPNFVRGKIDECGIWGRALTSGEITTLYNSGNGRTYPFN